MKAVGVDMGPQPHEPEVFPSLHRLALGHLCPLAEITGVVAGEILPAVTAEATPT